MPLPHTKKHNNAIIRRYCVQRFEQPNNYAKPTQHHCVFQICIRVNSKINDALRENRPRQ